MNEQNLDAGAKRKFFTKVDWAAFWSATVASFLVYFFTLGPSVGLEDSGELATAADHLGVPHPPGYPFWTLCGWIFCRLFSWVTYMGHPTPAWAMSLFSAVTGAFAAGCTAMLVCRSSMDMMQPGNKSDDCDGENRLAANSLFAFSGGVGAALVFAFSPVMWSQSTIVEVYSLNALFLMWVFLLSYRWMKKPSDKILWLTAFVFGLGLTNYQVLLLAAVPIAVIIALRDLKMFRDMILILIPIGLTYILLKIGCMLRANAYMSADVINKFEPVLKTQSCPNEIFLWAGCILAAIAPFVRRAWRQIGFAGVGLVFLAATVFAGPAEWTTANEQLVAPLLNPAKYAWIGALLLASVVCSLGFAFNTEKKDWRWLAAGGVCGLIALLVAASGPSADAAGYRGVPYSFLKANLMLMAGLTALFALVWKTPRGLAYAIPVAAVQLTTFTLLEKGAMNGLTNPHSWWFIWPIFWNFLVLGLAFVALPKGRSMAVATFLAELGVSFYAYMPIVSDLRNPAMNWGYPRTWEGFKHAITRGQYEAIKMGDVFSLHFLNELGFYIKDLRTQFTAVLMAVAIAAFPLGHLFTKKEHRRTWYSWLASIGSCFLMMSVLLIALANTKGDVQDGFIQKVKFISSHGMFALWIGYGLVFGAKFAVMLWNKVFGKKETAADGAENGTVAGIVPKWFIHLLCFLMLSTSLIPIYENYTNDRLVFELGSAEQNGHTFGWQFGAWQLDGAEEIRDELLADEEPLPNPLWPESMEPHSIFFGGTDPGRFVPTYMIYSANFRPDVYLITQNALADDTYMSVERDLYGDEIWIPSKEDSAESFQIYVEEVQSGKRNANADLKIENGRVQVTGALGVMEINGILTKMMFDHERLRHAFYVEESYVIQWMYPYLSPHGLIMKINKDKNPITPEILANDADFWDWYVRRLLKDKAFRRDFPAQKSFSKLRAAIAGLYSHTGRYREAEQAFREAVLLYPASPEASFRYIQEVLMPMRKWSTVEDILDYTDRVDPNNTRSKPMRSYMERMRQITGQIGALQAKAAKSGLSATENIILAGCFLQLGQNTPARGFTKKALESKDADFECFYRGSQILAQCGQRGDAAQAADRALKALPPNAPPHFRKELALTLIEGGMAAEANAQLNEYLRVQPKDAEAWLAAALAKDALSQTTEAQRSIIQAYQADANFTMDRIRQNEALQRIAAPLFRRK